MHRGGHKRPIPKVQLMASLSIPVSTAEVCTKPSVYCQGVSRKSLWVSESPEFLLDWWRLSVQILPGYPYWSIPQGWNEEILIPNQPTHTGRCTGWRLQAAKVVILERASSTTLLVVPTMHPGEGLYSAAPPLPIIKVTFVKLIPNQQFRTVMSA
jgi:hypothetical protein